MHCCLRVAIVIMQVAYNLKIETYFVYVFNYIFAHRCLAVYATIYFTLKSKVRCVSI